MDFSIIWKTPTGETIGNIDTQFVEAEWAFGEMSVGVLTLVVPNNDNYSVSDFGTDQIIWIKRLPPLWSGRGEDARVWFIRDIEADESVIRLTCYDALFLLSGRIVDAYAGTAGGSKTGYADDVIKAYVRENLGASAASERKLSNFTVEADTSKGYSISRAASRDNLLTVCREIAAFSYANGSYVSFDIEANSDLALTFKTFPGQRGADRSFSSQIPIVVGKQYKNVTEPKLKLITSREFTYVYCGGQGVETDRTLITGSASRATATPYNRRELFIDGRMESSTAELSSLVYAALKENAPLWTLEGKIIDNPGFRYGIDYDFGDRVVYTAFGWTMEARLGVVHVKIGSDGLQDTQILLKGEGSLS